MADSQPDHVVHSTDDLREELAQLYERGERIKGRMDLIKRQLQHGIAQAESGEHPPDEPPLISPVDLPRKPR